MRYTFSKFILIALFVFSHSLFAVSDRSIVALLNACLKRAGYQITPRDYFAEISREHPKQLQPKLGLLTPVKEGPILLLTPDQIKRLPRDTIVWSLNGKRMVAGQVKVESDLRDGLTPWGLRPKQYDSDDSVR